MRQITTLFLLALLSALLGMLPVDHQAMAMADPPPTPTLAPILGASPSATQTRQLAEFARDTYYQLSNTMAYTTTTSGAVWAVERRISYGEAAVVVVVMLSVLVQIGTLTYQFATRR